MLMTLGLFVFSLQTAPLNQLKRNASWKHASNSRIGKRDAKQYLGPGDEKVTLQGVIAPEITGGPANLEELRGMADQGKAWTLIDASGEVWGQFIINDINEDRTHFLPTGEARKIEFSLSLERTDNPPSELLGDINDTYSRFIA